MLIVIEGCLGAGKSTVARGLAEYRKSKLLLENFGIHPFLQAFYENPDANAIETEFTFLLLHFHQLKSQAQAASESEVISDFHLGKDLIYADLNLKDTHTKRIFKELYSLCVEKTPSPALMICLSATTDLLIDRIRLRKRDFELGVDYGYYAAVNAAYEQFFDKYSGPKLLLRMAEWDFVKDRHLFKQLSLQIDEEFDLQ